MSNPGQVGSGSSLTNRGRVLCLGGRNAGSLPAGQRGCTGLFTRVSAGAAPHTKQHESCFDPVRRRVYGVPEPNALAPARDRQSLFNRGETGCGPPAFVSEQTG